jgi:hypothetical protein
MMKAISAKKNIMKHDRTTLEIGLNKIFDLTISCQNYIFQNINMND